MTNEQARGQDLQPTTTLAYAGRTSPGSGFLRADQVYVSRLQTYVIVHRFTIKPGSRISKNPFNPLFNHHFVSKLHQDQSPTSRIRPDSTMLPTFYIALLIPTFASAAYLGGIDMNRACRDQYGNWVAYVSLAGGGCNAWKCAPASGEATPRGIDTPRACVNQYGTGAYAQCNGGEYDWGCYRN